MSLRKRIYGEDNASDDGVDHDAEDGSYPPDERDGEIAFTDDQGNLVRVPYATFRDQVLPARIQRAWADADQLHGIIALGVAEGCADLVGEASDHLRDIDTNVLRALCLHAFVLIETARAAEAEVMLARYLDRVDSDDPAHNAARIMLADSYWAQGKHFQAEKTLLAVLERDEHNEGAQWRLGEFFGRAA